jgi:hypothetical protein
MDFTLKTEIIARVTGELQFAPETDIFAHGETDLLRACDSLSPSNAVAIALDGLTLSWMTCLFGLQRSMRRIGTVLGKVTLTATRANLVARAWEGHLCSSQLRALVLRQDDIGRHDACLIPGGQLGHDALRIWKGHDTDAAQEIVEGTQLGKWFLDVQRL